MTQESELSALKIIAHRIGYLPIEPLKRSPEEIKALEVEAIEQTRRYVARNNVGPAHEHRTAEQMAESM